MSMAFTNSEKQVRTVNVILVLMARKVRVGLIFNATTSAKIERLARHNSYTITEPADLKHAWNGLRQVCATAARRIRGKFFRWPERAMDCNVACSFIRAPSCSGYT
jgi:hypothetical protein